MPNRSSSYMIRYFHSGSNVIKKYLVEIILIIILLYVCISRGMSINIDLYEPVTYSGGSLIETTTIEWGADRISNILAFTTAFFKVNPSATNSLTDLKEGVSKAPEHFNDVAKNDDPAPHISNLTLVLSPDYGIRKGLSKEIIESKRERVQAYVNRYATLAQKEMEENGIPASITLAQALLESNAGDSKLAVNSNNHFGIKCRKKCLGCTCRNYGDDSRYDMFRVFNSVNESFQEHSALLNTRRYAKLKKHGKDYRKWAHGLKACGYATDPGYGQKLIKIIENLGLDTYDN